MCRLCDATGPICRWITDPDWSKGSSHHVPFVPPSPDDVLSATTQTTSSQTDGLDGPARTRTAGPKAAARCKPLVKTGASHPKPAVFPGRLHWPALASGTHSSAAFCVPGAQSARTPPNVWCEPGAGLPNSAEVLCYAFLLVGSAADEQKRVAEHLGRVR